jgi:excinuclease ABC subunit C
MKWTEGKPDDYAMMQEALRRRLGGALAGNEKFLPLPDLVLLDGGKGQISAVQAVMDELGVPDIELAGLAKEQEEVFVPGQSDPITLPIGSRGHQLLVRLRDEAHRFAQGYHHLLREKGARKSVLDDAPGIGPVRRKNLLRRFKSVAKLREATPEQLAETPSMSRKAADELCAYLRRESEQPVEQRP